MAGIVELEALLQSLQPELQPGEYVFCTVEGRYADVAHLNPLACFKEAEGLTLILPAQAAEEGRLPFDGRFKHIALRVHSSLEAVGLTAAVATQLAMHGISANVVAAYFHDHIFVPAAKAQEALYWLTALEDGDGT
jgi:hypothetical protein